MSTPTTFNTARDCHGLHHDCTARHVLVETQSVQVLLQVLIDASNGASDYGNKFGEPLVAGYTRTFGMRMPDGSRREWIKPIMFR